MYQSDEKVASNDENFPERKDKIRKCAHAAKN